MRALALMIVWLCTGLARAEDPALRRVRQMLSRQETIRIFVDWSPRMGHQSASAHLLLRLRALGYDGPIEVIYGLPEMRVDEMRTKMGVLFPGFDRDGDEIQSVPSLGITYVSYARFKTSRPERVNLAMIAGEDNVVFASDLATDLLVITQPLGWEKPWGLEVDDGRNEYVVGLSHLKRFGHVYDVQTVPPTLVVPEHQLPKRSSVLLALRKLHQFRAQLDTTLYYGHGLYDGRTEQLAKFLTALVRAGRTDPHTFDKPIVVTVVHDAVTDLGDLHRMIAANSLLSRHVDAISSGQLGFDAAVDGLAPGRVLVALFPLIPPDLFHWFIAQATIAPVAGGRNSMNVLGQVGKAYLPSNQHESFHFLETRTLPTFFVNSDAWITTFNAREALLENDFTQSKVERIETFLHEARNPHSKVSELFRAGKLREGSDSDLVVRVLLEARQHIRRPERRLSRTCEGPLTKEPLAT